MQNAYNILTKFKGHAMTLKCESRIIALRQHCSPVGAMPNKYTAKITVKMRKSKMLNFAMQI